MIFQKCELCGQNFKSENPDVSIVVTLFAFGFVSACKGCEERWKRWRVDFPKVNVSLDERKRVCEEI